jgi:hypothetical protein
MRPYSPIAMDAITQHSVDDTKIYQQTASDIQTDDNKDTAPALFNLLFA